MGCCCFNTLRGAAFFVASIHIYNGLDCMLNYIAFPMVYSAMDYKEETDKVTGLIIPQTPFIAFLPGMAYAIIYFLLGCTIFRGIETEAIGAVKWSAVGFAITEVVFFILRVGLKFIPAPKVPGLPEGKDQPFEWNIYKQLTYFLFTIVGGIVYICILFLYVQKLSTGRDEFAQIASFLNSSRSAAAPPNPAPAGAPPPTSNNNIAAQPLRSDNPHHKSNKPPRDPDRKSSKGDPERKSRAPPGNAPPPSIGPVHPPSHHPQGVVGKEPQSPGSPMFPYFLIRKNSKLSASNKSPGGGQDPQGRMVEDVPPPGSWHQQPPPRIQGGVSLLNRQEFEGPPQGRGEVVSGRMLSPSMMNHHGQAPLPPPHGFQPIPPPFYSDSGDERRESFGVPGGFVSPTGSHYQQQGGYGRGQEALYQKIPMSPGFDYCLR